jgi:hypothetical protein
MTQTATKRLFRKIAQAGGCPDEGNSIVPNGIPVTVSAQPAGDVGVVGYAVRDIEGAESRLLDRVDRRQVGMP